MTKITNTVNWFLGFSKKLILSTVAGLVAFVDAFGKKYTEIDEGAVIEDAKEKIKNVI